MVKKIALIQGHPDPCNTRFCHALAEAYAKGAETAGHPIRCIDIAQLEFPLLRTKQDFDHGEPPAVLLPAQEIIRWAEHIVLFYPLWLGSMPAYLKAFLEQTFRPGFVARKTEEGKPWQKMLTGRSARVVVTMGMPAVIYRWFYLAHSLKSLERNILGFCGIGPVKETLIGMVDAMDDKQRQRWLATMRKLGAAGK